MCHFLSEKWILFHEEEEELGSVSDDDRLDVPGDIDLMCFETLCRCRASEKQTSEGGCVVHNKSNIKHNHWAAFLFTRLYFMHKIGFYKDLGSRRATF